MSSENKTDRTWLLEVVKHEIDHNEEIYMNCMEKNKILDSIFAQHE